MTSECKNVELEINLLLKVQANLLYHCLIRSICQDIGGEYDTLEFSKSGDPELSRMRVSSCLLVV